MSIQNLLNPETKDQEWSDLYCNTLNVRNLNLDEPDYIKDVLTPSNFTFIQGSGNISNLSSTYKVEGKWRTYTAGFRIGSVQAPSVNGVSRLLLDIEVNQINHPLNPDWPMNGSISTSIRDTASNQIWACNASVNRGSTNEKLSIEITMNVDVSGAPVATRGCEVQFHVLYETI